MSNSHIIQRREPSPAATLLNEQLHSVLARVYAARNITSAEQLDYSFKVLHNWQDLKGIQQAIELLSDALQLQQRVIIVGDFDADGATSSALAMRGLRAMGFQKVDYRVPDRFRFGYGLTPEIVEHIAGLEPDLIVTVDNGISSIEGVKAAKQRGIKVLVTDHHLPGEQLPDADAIVNPNQPGDAFPCKSLAGVGVMFYVLMALRAKLRELNWFENNSLAEPNLAQWLDIVALGTVADVVPLEHANRILVSQGIARMRAGQLSPGIKALLEVAGRNHQRLVASDLGFTVGPRINAAGRLDDMSLGIECLLTDSQPEAREYAQRLDTLNRERRQIETGMQEQAMQFLDDFLAQHGHDDLPVGLCLFEADWHEGVIGILASRIKDKLHRPVIAFAQNENGDLKGSARSVKGVHIRDVLDTIAARHPAMISKFGGHAMAAGLSLPKANLADFRQAFAEEVARHLGRDELYGTIYSDGELSESDLDMELAQLLRDAGPWGQQFEEPVFDGVFELVNRRIVGEKHLKLVVRLPSGSQCYDAIAFNTTDEDWPEQVEQVQLAYRLDVNEFRGNQNLQLMVEYIQPEQ
ncbi:MAG: single-stranded-DNA-specific exonuclease RecJ [Thioalkalispiraceae bacterium]|jgi:single-stranded-DNA-specific exonuclease